nr:hypothetical protein CPGR_03112 [Mycolicibacterium komanii]
MRDEQHDVFVGRGAHERQPQRRVGAQIERGAELALGQNLETQPTRVLGQLSEIVHGPAGRQIVVNGRLGFAVLVDGVGGAQQGVARGDRVYGVVQPGDVQVAGEPVGQADVEDGAGRVGRLDEPHAALPVGQADLLRGRGVLRAQSPLGELAAQQL